jgi:hypothetical protein
MEMASPLRSFLLWLFGCFLFSSPQVGPFNSSQLCHGVTSFSVLGSQVTLFYARRHYLTDALAVSEHFNLTTSWLNQTIYFGPSSNKRIIIHKQAISIEFHFPSSTYTEQRSRALRRTWTIMSRARGPRSSSAYPASKHRSTTASSGAITNSHLRAAGASSASWDMAKVNSCLRHPRNSGSRRRLSFQAAARRRLTS